MDRMRLGPLQARGASRTLLRPIQFILLSCQRNELAPSGSSAAGSAASAAATKTIAIARRGGQPLIATWLRSVVYVGNGAERQSRGIWGTHHVTQRGNNRQDVLFVEETTWGVCRI